MTWLQFFQQFNHSITLEEATYILWNETCYPFDDLITMKQIEKYYGKSNKV